MRCIIIFCFMQFLFVISHPVSSNEEELIEYDVSLSSETEKSIEEAKQETEEEVDEKKNIKEPNPKLHELLIYTNVSNRFATTSITAKMENKEKVARNAFFNILLPNTAYITSFTMEIDGQNYTAIVKNNLEAENIFVEVSYVGKAAGLIGTNVRDTNKFTVSVNIEPLTYAVFYLTYEELLKRRECYDIVINICPNQPVDKLQVKIDINEADAIKFVKTLPLKTQPSDENNEEAVLPNAKISLISRQKASIEFEPSVKEQEQLALLLNDTTKNGLSAQFIVQYDVERNYDGGEILIKDGYFVHFFSPTNAEPLPKHVVFVLDTSGSMMFQKIEQLRIAMKSIVRELKNSDIFHLVEFNNDVLVWNISHPEKSVRFPEHKNDGFWFSENRQYYPIDNVTFPSATEVNANTTNWTCSVLDQIDANGGTNVYEALRVSIQLIEREKVARNNSYQPIVIFLTDGEPTIGVTNSDDIIAQLRTLNKQHIPIFSLSFGDGADRELLKRLSLENYGFSKHIYEAADAALQLENFYREVSSPLLTNVTFKYTEETRNLSKTVFPIYFDGGEFVVTGYTDDVYEFGKDPRVSGWGVQGPVDLRPHFQEPAGELERLWAYLTVQQSMENINPLNHTYYEEKATELALKYSFVTPLTSLVVYRPGDAESIITIHSNNLQFENNNNDLILAPEPVYHNVDASIMDFEDDFDNAAIQTRKENDALLDGELVEKILPWIKNYYNKNNSTITLPQGNYILNSTVFETSKQICNNVLEVSNKTLHCTFLTSCSSLNNDLSSLDNYLKLFCAINNTYAGVCCPDI